MSNLNLPALSPEKPTRKSWNLTYLPALDGLRALAVLAVLLYHADVVWLPGGFFGVEIFFVVSGYLITSLLLAEYRTRNSIQLKNFWRRRARRLLPGLFATIFAVLIYSVIFLPDEVASLRGDAGAAFLYITNWYLIFAQQSYFETMGRPSLLLHLWSLAVEEQFYLVWPLVFAFVLTRLKTRGALWLLMFCATLSAVWMGLLYQPDADPSRIYYGTDTRAAGLLIGAALAFVWSRANIVQTSRMSRWALDMVGVAALGGLLAACLFLSEFDAFLYQGGMLLVAAATAFVIAAVVSPYSPIFSAILGNPVLRWIGLRSYSLYLWHWPIFMVTRPQLDTTLEGTPLLVLRLAVTFAAAELSYRVIESPIRNGALGQAWNAWQASRGKRRLGLSALGIALAVFFFAGAFALGSVVLNAQPPAQPDFVLDPEQFETDAVAQTIAPTEIEQTEVTQEMASDLSPVSYVILDTTESTPHASSSAFLYAQDSWLRARIAQREPLVNTLQADAENWRLRRATPNAVITRSSARCDAQCETRLDFLDMKQGIVRAVTPSARTRANQKPTPVIPKTALAPISNPRVGPAPILAIGDSVMLGASYYFRKIGLDVDVDAKIGRQVSTAINLLKTRKDANLLSPVVLIHLGNNGTFTAKQFDEMMAVLHDVPRVIFLNTKVPRKWQDPNNTALVQGVKKYPNAMLIDWNAASNEHIEWFWNDGIHLRPEGAQVYVNLIAQYIDQANP